MNPNRRLLATVDAYPLSVNAPKVIHSVDGGLVSKQPQMPRWPEGHDPRVDTEQMRAQEAAFKMPDPVVASGCAYPQIPDPNFYAQMAAAAAAGGNDQVNLLPGHRPPPMNPAWIQKFNPQLQEEANRMAMLPSIRGPTFEELPPEWDEERGGGGQVFYRNRETGEIRWTKPPPTALLETMTSTTSSVDSSGSYQGGDRYRYHQQQQQQQQYSQTAEEKAAMQREMLEFQAKLWEESFKRRQAEQERLQQQMMMMQQQQQQGNRLDSLPMFASGAAVAPQQQNNLGGGMYNKNNNSGVAPFPVSNSPNIKNHQMRMFSSVRSVESQSRSEQALVEQNTRENAANANNNSSESVRRGRSENRSRQSRSRSRSRNSRGKSRERRRSSSRRRGDDYDDDDDDASFDDDYEEDDDGAQSDDDADQLALHLYNVVRKHCPDVEVSVRNEKYVKLSLDADTPEIKRKAFELAVAEIFSHCECHIIEGSVTIAWGELSRTHVRKFWRAFLMSENRILLEQTKGLQQNLKALQLPPQPPRKSLSAQSFPRPAPSLPFRSHSEEEPQEFIHHQHQQQQMYQQYQQQQQQQQQQQYQQQQPQQQRPQRYFGESGRSDEGEDYANSLNQYREKINSNINNNERYFNSNNVLNTNLSMSMDEGSRRRGLFASFSPNRTTEGGRDQILFTSSGGKGRSSNDIHSAPPTVSTPSRLQVVRPPSTSSSPFSQQQQHQQQQMYYQQQNSASRVASSPFQSSSTPSQRQQMSPYVQQQRTLDNEEELLRRVLTFGDDGNNTVNRNQRSNSHDMVRNDVQYSSSHHKANNFNNNNDDDEEDLSYLDELETEEPVGGLSLARQAVLRERW